MALLLLVSSWPSTLAHSRSGSRRIYVKRAPSLLNLIRNIGLVRPKLRQRRPALRNRNTLFRHQFKKFKKPLSPRKKPNTSSNHIPETSTKTIKSTYKTSIIYKGSGSEESRDVLAPPVYTSNEVLTPNCGIFYTHKSDDCNTIEKPLQSTDITTIYEYPKTTRFFETLQSPLTTKELQIQTSISIFLENNSMRVAKGSFTEVKPPTQSKLNQYPISPSTSLNQHHTSSLPTYSPEIYIKDQPPEIYEIVPHSSNSFETSEQYKDRESSKEAAPDKTPTSLSDNYQQPVALLSGTFSTFDVPRYESKQYTSSQPSIGNIKEKEANVNPFLKTTNNKSKHQFFPPIPSYINFQQNINEPSWFTTYDPPPPTPLNGTFSEFNIPREKLNISPHASPYNSSEVSLSEFQLNPKDTNAQKYTKEQPVLAINYPTPPPKIYEKFKQEKSHTFKQNLKSEKTYQETALKVSKTESSPLTKIDSKPEITSTYMQERTKHGASSSEQFLLKHNWNQLFKDDFPFPFGQITPREILNNIAVLSGTSAVDSKFE